MSEDKTNLTDERLEKVAGGYTRREHRCIQCGHVFVWYKVCPECGSNNVGIYREGVNYPPAHGPGSGIE